MGSPLPSILSKIYLNNIENTHIFSLDYMYKSNIIL